MKMLSSLGITHHVFPTSSLFFGGKKTLNCLAEKEAEGTAGLFQECRPLRELWDTCRGRKTPVTTQTMQMCHQSFKVWDSFLLINTKRNHHTPRNPSLLFVMESRSRGCIMAPTVNVSPSGSSISSSSKSTGGMIPSEGKKRKVDSGSIFKKAIRGEAAYLLAFQQ